MAALEKMMVDLAETEHLKIERYITGLMDEQEALDFEAFILTRTDWREKVSKARALFDKAQVFEWETEINEEMQRIKKEEKLKPKTNWLFVIFSNLLAFGTGALVMLMLSPVLFFSENSSQLFDVKNIQSINLDVVRSVDSNHKMQAISIDKETDSLQFKFLVKEETLDESYLLEVMIRGKMVSQNLIKPDVYGKVKVNLIGDFKNDDLIVIDLKKKTNTFVMQSYRILVKEK